MQRKKRILLLLILLLLVSYVVPCLSGGDRKADYLELRKLIGKEKFKEAIERCKELIDIYPDYLYLYETLAEVSQYAGDLDNAVKYFEHRIEEGSQIGWAYFGLGNVLYYKKDYRAAVLSLNKATEFGISAPECFRTLVYAYEKLEGLDAAIRAFNSLCQRNPGNANYRYALGLAYWSKSDYKNVLANVGLAISLNPSELKYLEAKGGPLLQIGDKSKALDLIRQLLPLAQKRGDLAGSLFLRSTLVCGYVWASQQDSARAEAQELLQEAGEFGSFRWVGWALRQKMEIEYFAGDYSNALLSAEKALKASEYADDARTVVSTIFLQLETNIELGNFDEALGCASRVMGLTEPDGHNNDYVMALYDIAWIYNEIGVYDVALDYAIEALAKAESFRLDRHLCQTQSILGSICEGTKDHKEALNHYILAHRLILHSVLWSGLLSTSHHNLGNAFLKLGEYEKSRAHFFQGLFLSRKGGNRRDEVYALKDLGDYYLQKKKYVKARRYYERGFAEAEVLRHKPVVLLCQRGLASIAEATGNPENALIWHRRAIQTSASMGFARQNSMIGKDLRRDRGRDYRDCVHLLCSLGRIDEAFEVAEEGKVQLGSDLAGVSARKLAALMPDSSRARIFRLKSELEQKHAALAAGPRRTLPMKDMDRDLRIISNIESLEIEYRKILDSLRIHDRRFLDLLQPSPLTAREVQKFLIPDNQALLEYVVGDRQTDAFLVKSDTILHFTIRKGRDELSRLLGKMSSVFGQDNRHERLLNAAIADFDLKRSHELYSLLVRPIEPDIRDVRQLVIVADDVLKVLPFEVLATSSQDGGNPHDFTKAQYLVWKYEMSYAAGATFLDPRYRTTRQAPKSMLAVGNPTITNVEDDLVDKLGIHMQKPTDTQFLHLLPGAQQEVDRVSKVFENKIDVLVRDQASKAFFKQFASDYKVLHIAAHATIDNNRPMYSSIHLASNPETKQSGAFRAFEFLNLDLNADLAVLSSCNTGSAQGAQGPDGFVRGLFFAGVPSVVSSLWSVDDQATAQLMENFYRYLKNGERKSRALQLAKLDLIKSGKADPYYWGAFVLMGDTSPIDFSEPAMATAWTWAVAFGVAASMGVLMIYRRVSIYRLGKYGARKGLKGSSISSLERS